MGSLLKMISRQALTVFTLVLATLIVVPPILAMSLIPRTDTPIFQLMKLWAWMVTKAMGFTCEISGVEKITPGVSYVLAPNHQGDADSLALTLELPVRFRWVMKKELAKIPLFGWALTATGAISVDRSKGNDALKRLRLGGGKLTEGWCVLIYPEGTRTSDGRLQPFKRGAFIMAVHTGCPILPIAVNGAYEIMPKGSLAISPGHIRITICDPIDTEGKTEDDVPGLMEMTRAAIMKNLDPNALPQT